LIRVDSRLLEETGLGALPRMHHALMCSYIYETVEERVGARLAKDLSNSELDTFESLFDSGAKSACTAWIQQRCPNYQVIVHAQWSELKTQLRRLAPKLVAVSMRDQVPHPAETSASSKSAILKATGTASSGVAADEPPICCELQT
jgi:hypothetical protein